MKSPSLTSLGLDIEPHRAELAALLRLLSVGQGCFSLSIAVCNAPVLRDRLIEEVRRQFPTVKVLSIPAETVDVYGFVRDQVAVSESSGLFLIGLEASLSDSHRDQPTLQSLNASRDLWPTRFPLPVVLWLPEYAARTLSETARDFWRIRSHRFSFLMRDDRPVLRSSEMALDRYSASAAIPYEEKLARIAELKQRIDHAGEPTPELRPNFLSWLHELYCLYLVLGDLEAAEAALERSFTISGRDAETAETAAVLGNLGVIYQTRGEWERAEEVHRKALAIYEKLNREEGMARQYGNLGIIYWKRGELDRAERVHQQSLAIFEKLGSDEGTAREYGNLGAIYQTRGELDRAEEMFQRALTSHEKSGRQEGMAAQYGNLGLIYRMQGKLDRAEEMLQKALASHEKFGNQAGIALDYGNLGRVAFDRGDMKQARKLWEKARDLFAQVGITHEMQKHQNALDLLPKE